MEKYAIFLDQKKKILKMIILSKVIYRFNAIPLKLSISLFIELEQIILQFLFKHKRLQIAKVRLRQKNGTGRIRLSNFRLYYKATVIKQMVLAIYIYYRLESLEHRDKATHLWSSNQ